MRIACMCFWLWSGGASSAFSYAYFRGPGAELVCFHWILDREEAMLIAFTRDGHDGPWSSFTLRVGTPAQNVRVFVSSSSSATWVVLSGACPTSDSNCIDERGDAFNPNTSSTWSQHGNFQLSVGNLNITAGAVFGNDTLGLGIQGSGGPTLQKQVIGAYASDELYLGMFGVNPASTNFSATDKDQPSYMATLKDQNLIPSISFGYTAGNQYRLKQVLGSLTLGGYDAVRFTPNNLSIPFAKDSARQLMVGIQSISSMNQNGNGATLLSNGIMSNVDTRVPQIWLPVEACQAFEKAFGLNFDETSGLYLVNTALHNQLLDQNASITFTLGATATGGQTTNLTLPYASFDLLVKPPTAGVANNTRYFPLRRAANDSQYTLGRTFLQEAYLIVDWERQNFSISQCEFSDNMSPNLLAIASAISSSGSGGSSTGKTVGIAVGVVVAIIVIAAAIGAFFFIKKRKERRQREELEKREDTPPDEVIRQGFAKGELGTGIDNQRYEMAGSDANVPKPEDRGGSPSQWVDEKARYPGDRSHMAEVEGGAVSVSELPSRGAGGTFAGPFHEMYDPSAPTAGPVELPAEFPKPELQGSNPTSAASSPRVKAVSSNRRSFRDRWSKRPQPSRSSTMDSLPSPAYASGPSSSPPPRPQRGTVSSGEVFSPVSRQGTFTPDNVGPSSSRGGQPFSPVSPTSPEMGRGKFGHF